MGCFSFMCQGCGKSLQSSSFAGDHSKLFLLKKGKVIQEMTGQYDSYGRVFAEGTKDSQHWDMDWGDVCDLMFDPDEGSGIAAFHTKCYDGRLPVVQSDNDPNQGWGDDGGFDGDREFYSEFE